MRRTFKILGLTVGILVLLLVIAAVIAPLVINPNDFKPRIQAAVEEATGRSLDIPGDIDLSVFPWLGVKLGAVRLGNAEGFGNAPFAAVEGVQVRVKLLPLLSKNIEVGKIIVEQPVVRLEKDVSGRSNWDDLAGARQEEVPPPSRDSGDVPELSVDGLEIRGGHVFYADASTKSKAELQNLSLEAGEIRLPADFPLAMKGTATLSNPEVSTAFEFNGRVVADTGKQQYAVHEASLVFDAQGKGLPVSPVIGKLNWDLLNADMTAKKARVESMIMQLFGSSMTISAEISGLTESVLAKGEMAFSAEDLSETARQLGTLLPESVTLSGKAGGKLGFSFDQAAGTAKVPEFSISAMGMDVAGNLDARNLNDKPAFTGAIKVKEFSPGQLLVKLGQDLPETQDGEVFDRAALSANFNVASNRAVISDLHAVLDQTKLTGSMEIADIEKQAVRFKFAVDQLDADRYLPPATDKPSEQGEEGASLDQVEIPAELIRGHDIVGSLTIGKLKAFDFNSTDVNIGVTAQYDRLRIHPAEAKFYDGGYRGDIRLDASGKVPAISVDEHVDRIQLAPLVKDVLEVENISGSAQIDVIASAKGKTVGALRKTLKGNFKADIKDGAIEGFNLWESIREAYARFKGRTHDASKAPKRTEFAELSATGRIDKGILHNDDLLMKMPFLRVTGEGEINIANATLDYTVEAGVLKSPELKGGIEELSGTAIPVRLTGPLTSPKVRPDVKSVLEAKAKEALKQKEQELRDEAKERAEEERQRLEDKLKDKLKDFVG